MLLRTLVALTTAAAAQEAHDVLHQFVEAARAGKNPAALPHLVAQMGTVMDKDPRPERRRLGQVPDDYCEQFNLYAVGRRSARNRVPMSVRGDASRQRRG